MRNVITYIDGFNLYHSIDDLGDRSLKWLDLWALSETMLRENQRLVAVKYFSAYATWLSEAHKRQREYVSVLEAQGVTIILGRFKKKYLNCKAKCGEQFVTHEEKETDVNIGAHLIADAIRGRFETAFVISADTDIMAAVRLAREERPDLKILLVAPPKRANRSREMKHSFELTIGRLRKCLLPQVV